MVEQAQAVTMIAATRFDSSTQGSQSVAPSGDEYNDVFSVKSYTFGDDLDD